MRWKEIVTPVEANEALPPGGGFHERLVIYHFSPADEHAQAVIEQLLSEEKKYVDVGKGRALMFHKAHVPNTDDHLHFVVKGAKVAALNKDGTAHDQSHGFQMQKWAIDGIKKHYPGFTIPKEGLIEQIMGKPEAGILNEGFTAGEILMPKANLVLAMVAIQEALAQEKL